MPGKSCSCSCTCMCKVLPLSEAKRCRRAGFNGLGRPQCFDSNTHRLAAHLGIQPHGSVAAASRLCLQSRANPGHAALCCPTPCTSHLNQAELRDEQHGNDLCLMLQKLIFPNPDFCAIRHSVCISGQVLPSVANGFVFTRALIILYCRRLIAVRKQRASRACEELRL